ncbi:histidine phosphatase family protein [Aureimonas sp. OT7]|uniref:histidine phosphatase family protein n=1 Tax=Aureimonas sp. OT7 TaxID=2816454 RepID=UPI00178069CD|nr:histidine phosphatase family protein [Aureimonas sp. OT7]QOG05428.1 histidine phosphatase family protein [Aureimonas sp. OT7]
MNGPARMVAMPSDSAATGKGIGQRRRFLVLRHAPTAWNADGRIQGRTDCPLSPEGHERALTWRVPAGFCRAPCFSSPLRRCLDTARAMGLSPVVDDRLVEMDWGTLEGATLAGMRAGGGTDFARREAAGLDFRPPGGETPRETGARAVAVLAQATSDAVIVTHKGVMRALLALATGWDMVGKPPIRFPAEGHALLMEWREGVLYLQPDTVDMRN